MLPPRWLIPTVSRGGPRSSVPIMSTSSGAQSHSKSDAKSTPSEGDRNEHESSEDGFPEKALNIKYVWSTEYTTLPS